MADEHIRDWAAFYAAKLGNAAVPALSSREYRANQAIVRDRYLDAQVEMAEIHRRVPQLAAVFLYCDVLRIPKGYSLKADGFGLVVCARRVEFEDAVSFIGVDWSKTENSSLNLFALEVAVPKGAHPLPIRWISRSTTNTLTGYNVTPKGLAVVYAGGSTVRIGTGIPAKLLAEDSQLALSLGSIFQTASLLFHDTSAADVARAQLTWVQACAAQSPAQTGLMLQSAGLLSMLQVRASGTTFVPQLSRTVYAETARAYSEKARAIAQQYERFADQKETIDARIAAAKLLVQNADDAISYTDKLIEQATSNLACARNALSNAEVNLRKQQDQAERAAGQFQVSLNAWLEQKKIEAAFKIVSAVVQFSVAAGKIAYGDPSGAAAADGALQSLSGMASFGVYAEAAKQVAETIEKLKKVLETLGKLYTMIEQIVAASIDLSKAGDVREALANADLSQSADISLEAWEMFRLRADDQLEFVVKEGVADAADYRLQLRGVVIYGKALSTTRSAAVASAQELARLQLLRTMHANEKARAEKYIADLVQSKEPKAALQQLMYQRFIDTQRSLVVAIEQYRAAFEYWALQPSSTTFKIGDRVDVFQTGLNELATMKLNTEAALKGFDPPPQPLNETFLINDPAVLAALRANRLATFSISLDRQQLISLSRVRVHTLRTWLIGTTPNTVEVVIENSGSYVDRMIKGTTEQRFSFTSKPCAKVFRYSLTPSGTTRIELPDITGWVNIDSRIDDEVRYEYFVPTPFSQWAIRVPETSNPDIDLTKVTGIRVQLTGSAIPNKNIKGAVRQ